MATDIAMVVMAIMDMVMARERLMLLLKLMPRLDITMATDTAMEDMDTMDMVMARERLRPRLDTPITDMVDMVDIPAMDMATEDMVAMDTMVKQQLFICPTNFSKFDLDLYESSQKKHTPDIKNIKIHSLK